MGMNITTFQAYEPDGDGDISFQLDSNITNETDQEVKHIRTSVMMLNSDGVCIGGSHGDQDEFFAEAGECSDYSPSISFVPQAGFPDGNIRVIVDATLCRKEFRKLGNLPVPKNAGFSQLSEHVTFSDLVQVMGIAMIRKAADEDGEIKLEIACGVKNTSSMYIDACEIQARLIDEQGSELEESSEREALAPFETRIFTPTFWGLKKGKLKDCVVQVSISLMVAVAHYTADAGTTVP